MILSIYSGSNAPETTNVLMGTVVNSFLLDVTTFTTEQKAVYDAFFNAVGNYTSVNIINSPHELDVTHVTPEFVAQEVIEIDYLTLSIAEKKAVDDAVALLMESIDTEIFYPVVEVIEETSSDDESVIEN